MSNNNDNKKGLDRFRDRHPVLVNLVLMLFALVVLGYIALLFIDVFTSHGQQVQVPDVRNMPLEKAIEILDDAGLKWDISDSTNYEEQYAPGTVIDQDPKAASYIKKIRVIYLKVNAMHARMVSLPKLQEISGRQGMAMLRSMGFKNITMDSIASPYSGLILQVTVDGHHVAPGTSIPVNAAVRITVGDGSLASEQNPDQVIDAATMDSIDNVRFEAEEERYMQEMEAEQARLEQEQREQSRNERRHENKEQKSRDNNNNKDSKTSKDVKAKDTKSSKDAKSSKENKDSKSKDNNKDKK